MGETHSILLAQVTLPIYTNGTLVASLGTKIFQEGVFTGHKMRLALLRSIYWGIVIRAWTVNVTNGSFMRRTTDYAGFFHELSFSIYSAFLVVLEESWKMNSRFLDLLGYPLYGWIDPLVAKRFRGDPFWLGVRQLHYMELWVFLSLIFFGVLHFMVSIKQVRLFLRNMAGIVIVSGMPLFWLTTGGLPGLSSRPAQWLLFEVCIVAVAALFCGFQSRKVSFALSVLVLVVHFAIWGLISSEWFTEWVCWVCFFMGSFTALMWALCARDSSHYQLNDSSGGWQRL